MAGAYIADLKAASTNLAYQLGSFQAALGVELNANIQNEFEVVRKGLVNMELKILRSMEERATSLRFAFDQQMARGTINEDQLRRLLVDCLETAGVGINSVSKKVRA